MRLTLFISIILLSSIISAQNVGINTLNPKEQLHVKSDSAKIALRLDNKKSVEAGFDYFTVVATPSLINNAPSIPGTTFVPWTDFDNTKLINSDDNRLIGPILNLGEWASATIRFTIPSSIPSNAVISDVSINGEWRLSGTGNGSMLINPYLMLDSYTHFYYVPYYVSSSNDKIFITSLSHDLTPADINSGQYYLLLNTLLNANTQSRIEIDKLTLEIEYKIPATTIQDVSWSAGTKEGTFKITNSANLNSKEYLSIDESGTTLLKGLKITKNAGHGKVLTSNQEGKAFWAEIPDPDINVVWLNKEDTAYYAKGPVQIDNNAPNPALIFSKGDSRLNNGINMIETDNRVLNVIIDADNNQVNEQFNIYRDSTQILAENPSVRFNLGGNDSWINTGGSFIIGSDELPPATAITDTLMFFDKSKGAFRAGNLSSFNSWAPDSIGHFSFASGRNAKASGYTSTAMGDYTTASGTSSTAMGSSSTASGINSTAMGDNTTASGISSTAMGINTTALANYSTAMGLTTTASGYSSIAIGNLTISSGTISTAMGFNTTASANYSTAMGGNTTASGNRSTAMGDFTIASGFASLTTGSQTTASGSTSTALGRNTKASGDRSTAIGFENIAKGYASTVIGVYNDSILVNDQTAVTQGTPLFIVGNGDDSLNRSNAMVIAKNGRIGLGLNQPMYPIHNSNGAHLTIAGVWTNASDIRFKSAIKPIHYGLKELMQLQPSTYTVNTTGEQHIGFIAQDLKKIIPEVVSGIEGDMSTGETLGVSYANMVALLTKAMQEQQALIQKQQAIIEAHGALITSLQNQLNSTDNSNGISQLKSKK